MCDSQQNTANNTAEREFVRIFLGGLSTRKELVEVFKYFKTITNVKNHIPRKGVVGFCFISVENNEEIRNLLKAKMILIGESHVNVEIAGKRGQKNLKKPSLSTEQEFKVFIGGLDLSITDNDLCKYFKQFGDLKKAYISRLKSNGKSRGFGYAIFRDQESQKRSLYCQDHSINSKKFSVREAISKEDISKANQRTKLDIDASATKELIWNKEEDIEPLTKPQLSKNDMVYEPLCEEIRTVLVRSNSF